MAVKQRLNQGKLQRARDAVSRLINEVHDARLRYAHCSHLRPRQLGVLSRLLKQMVAARGGTPEQEVELKQRLTRARQRVLGSSAVTKPLAHYLPACYGDALAQFDLQSAYLLRVLADVTAEPSGDVASLEAAPLRKKISFP